MLTAIFCFRARCALRQRSAAFCRRVSWRMKFCSSSFSLSMYALNRFFASAAVSSSAVIRFRSRKTSVSSFTLYLVRWNQWIHVDVDHVDVDIFWRDHEDKKKKCDIHIVRWIGLGFHFYPLEALPFEPFPKSRRLICLVQNVRVLHTPLRDFHVNALF